MTDVATGPAVPATGLADDALGGALSVSSPVGPAEPPGPAGGSIRPLPLEALHDVELSVEVVLGRARMALRDLLGAHPGTTIELDRSVHGSVDVMVNGTLFARGDMVVIDDAEIGVQVTEVIGAEMPGGNRL